MQTPNRAQEYVMMSEQVDAEKYESVRRELQRDVAWRRERVCVAAYFNAERRSFAPGGEATDWCLAEAQVNALDEAGA